MCVCVSVHVCVCVCVCLSVLEGGSGQYLKYRSKSIVILVYIIIFLKQYRKACIQIVSEQNYRGRNILE